MKKVGCKILLSVFIVVLSVFLGGFGNSYAQTPSVVEQIVGVTENDVTTYTYTYTLQNLAAGDIWWWGVLYEEDPQAILDDEMHPNQTLYPGLAVTDVEDCSTGWKNTAPGGRMGFSPYQAPEGSAGIGFYSTYADDFYSGNAENLGTGLGGELGWNGTGANIQTSYGIGNNETGVYEIQSTTWLPDSKSFFYNTVDYWNSYYDTDQNKPVIEGFKGFGDTEVCDGIDNNGNGDIDEGFDLDADTYTTCNGDCDDNNAAINPGATEIKDGIDNDCDSYIDEGFGPGFSTFPIREGEVGSLYSYTVTLKGEEPFTWSFGDNLPFNMADTGTGRTITLTGTPADLNAGESYTITLDVTNSNGTAQQQWVIEIKPLLSNNIFTGTVSSTPTSFCDGECGVLPFKMQIWHGLRLKASTGTGSITCQYQTTPDNYSFHTTGLKPGIYTIIVTDNNPGDNNTYKTTMMPKLLKTGANTQDIQMQVLPAETRMVFGSIKAQGDTASITLYGQTTADENKNESLTVPIDQTGSGPFAFYVPSGTYNLSASAPGHESEEVLNLNIQQADFPVSDIVLTQNQKPSLNIGSNQEEGNKLRLNFRYTDPDGQPTDWVASNKVKITLFVVDDDVDTPTGKIFPLLVHPNNLGTAGAFDESYLTCLINAETDFTTSLEENGTTIYKVKAQIQLLDSLDNNLIDPLTPPAFEVKNVAPAQQSIAQTTNTTKVSNISSLSDIQITGNLQVGEEEIPIKASVNASGINPTLLNTVDATGEKQAMVGQDDQITLQVELKPKEDDPGCTVVDIKFTDSSGNIVEYNPPDDNGDRDENAAPIIIDIPLHTTLQGKFEGNYLTPSQARAYVACDPDNDFELIPGDPDGKYRPKRRTGTATEGRMHGIYFDTPTGAELFIPGTGEAIEIVSSESGLLMARVTIKHTTPFYSQGSTIPPELTTTPPPPSIKVQVEYTYTPTATGDPTIKWSLEEPFPTGMAINLSTGEITWTPDTDQIGDHSVTLKAENEGGSATQTVTIEVYPDINSSPSTGAKVGEEYTYSPTVIGEGTIYWSLTTTIDGMTINPDTGQIAWTPNKTQTGINNVTLRVMVNGKQDTQRWIVSIDKLPGGLAGGGDCFILTLSP